MEKRPGSSSEHGPSTGHALADAGWPDLHFEACRPEYEATVHSVGIQPGWRVLDAGSGSGSFLPVLADLVGSSGQLTVLDLTPENVTAVVSRFAESALACRSIPRLVLCWRCPIRTTISTRSGAPI